MAKKAGNRLRATYLKALRHLGEQLTGRERTSTLKNKWKALREGYKERGEKAPNLYDTAKNFEYEQSRRDNEMNTPPAAIDLREEAANQVIEQFIWTVDQIYEDTLRYIEENKEGTGHSGGKLASIADYRRHDIDETYFNLKQKIAEIQSSGAPATVIAQAIQDNVELDYVISVALSPPSDLEFKFNATIEQLDAVMLQIEQRAKELAEEAEREYLGE